MAWTLLVSPFVAVPAASAAPVGVNPNGQWSPVADWPLIALHAALDSRGRVVTYGTNGDGQQTGRFIYDIWNPGPNAANGHRTLANTTETDLFCSLQLNRPDTGNMVLFGGDNWTGAGTTNTGNPDINQLNASTGRITTLPGMNRPRWYATGVTMPTGSMFVQGGLGGEDLAELWTPGETPRLLPPSTAGLYWYYPRNFVMPDGRVFGFDTTGRMYFLSTTLDTLTRAGFLPNDRDGIGATAVQFEPGKILQFGGATATAVVIDVTSGNPVVTRTGSLSSARQWVNATVLPDGRVLATGGSTKESSVYPDDAIGTYGVNNTAEIWDPNTGQWTQGGAAQVPRLYHSTALLLPDGRVLTAGGGAPGPIANTDAEIFSPDYLVAAGGGSTTRPVINSMSATSVTPGQDLRLNTSVPGQGQIERVTMVKTGSVTHSFNMEQRFVELNFRQTNGGVAAQIPASGGVVTPGYYMVSVIDDQGIPSESEMVRVEVPRPQKAVAGVDGQIVRLYQAYFDRNPDADGYVFWRNQLLAGDVTLVQMSDTLSGNAEFIAAYGALGNGQFIDQIYLNVLGRAPDAAGRRYWMGQFRAGVGRGALVLALAESIEFVNVTGTPALDAPNAVARDAATVNPPQPPPPPPPVADAVVRAQIYRLYYGYFGRAPDAEGWAYWIEQRQNGLSLIAVADEFALSGEFARQGAATDPDFVDFVYRSILRRRPDSEGRQYWIGQLRGGLARGELVVGFTESQEFVRLIGPVP